MDYILKSRGRGKTYDLIVRSSRTGERIICANRNMAKYVNEKAKDMGLHIVEPKSYDYLTDNSYDHTNEKVLIDELSYVLKQVLHIDVTAITDTPKSIILNTEDVSTDSECYRKHYFKK